MQRGGGVGEGEQMLVARATEGLFWASDFADDEKPFPCDGWTLPSPLLEGMNVEPNI